MVLVDSYVIFFVCFEEQRDEPRERNGSWIEKNQHINKSTRYLRIKYFYWYTLKSLM